MTLRPLQVARQSLATAALQAPRRGTRLLQWAPGRWPSGFGTCSFSHYTCCPQLTGHAFLWSQVRRTVRDMSPITLTSLKRARRGSLWINMSGEAQHKACVAGVGMILACATPWGFPIETSVPRQEMRRPSSGSRLPVSPLVTGTPCFQAWFLACRHWSYTQKPLTSQPYSHHPWGTPRKRYSSAKQSFSRQPLAFMPSIWSFYSHA